MNKMSGGTITQTGVRKVLIAGIKFTNEVAFTHTTGELQSAIHGMANFYNTNSRNLLQVVTEVHMVAVPFFGNAKNVLNQAGPYVKNRFPGKDIYVIVSKFVDGDHAGNGFAYVKSTLTRDIQHECGHCLGLAHAGSYVYTGKGYTYEQYGDGLSPMSAFAGTCLTSPAYYYLNWTPQSEIVTINNVSQLPATFQLKRINNFGGPGISMIMFKDVILKNPTGRDAFISFPQRTNYFGSKPFAALHFRNAFTEGFGGGSAKIKTFANAFYDSIFTNLNMKIESTSTTDQLVITVSLSPPATAYPIELVPLNDSEVAQ